MSETPTAADPSPDQGAGRSLWHRRVVVPVMAQLQQGITPEQIALTLALGGVLGIFPILGATSVLCAIAGVGLRLNQPIIQLVNFLMYPLQVVLLLPFYRAGEALFGQPQVPIFSVVDLLDRFSTDPWQFLRDYGMVGIYGITVWCALAPALVAALYFGLRPVLRGLARQLHKPA